MPIFMIERRYAEDFVVDSTIAAEINLINADEGVQWLYSFLATDLRKTFCLYEATSMEAIQRAAVRAGIPADVIIPVRGRVEPDGSMVPI